MLQEELKKKNIVISLQVFEPNDLSIGWEVQSIIDNPDIFDNFYSKYPLSHIVKIEDYYLYLLSLKLQSLANSISRINSEEHKEIVANICAAATESVQNVSVGEVVKYINNNTQEIFESEHSSPDIRAVTIDLISKYNRGIGREVFIYLCKTHSYFFIERFENFESVFDQDLELFKVLFPLETFEKYYPYRINEVFEIWFHIIMKGNATLKDYINSIIPAIFDKMVILATTATLDNVIRIEGPIRKFHYFLKKIYNPLANKFSPHAKAVEQLVSQSINEHGYTFKYEIPVGKMIEEWKKTDHGEIRLLMITHILTRSNNNYDFSSNLSEKTPSKSVIIDIVSTNIPTDSYYTVSHQQNLEIISSLETGMISGILNNPETKEDYYGLVYSAITFIAEQMSAVEEGLIQDAEMLLTMIQLIIDNREAEEKILQSLCYSASIFICTYIEKILRFLYIDITKERFYVPANRATLGELLTVDNKDILRIFGEHHIKGLSFFLLQTPQKGIGRNIRNNLAHWSCISVNELTPIFVARLIWIFTDILNTVFWFYLKGTEEVSTNDQL